jgi:hypothetical protein
MVTLLVFRVVDSLNKSIGLILKGRVRRAYNLFIACPTEFSRSRRVSSSSSASTVKGKNSKGRADVWIDLLWRDESTREIVSPNGLQGFVTVLVVLGCSSLVQLCLACSERWFPRHEQPFILRDLPLTCPQECNVQSRRLSVADSSPGNSLN